MQYVMMVMVMMMILTLKCYDSETGISKKYALKLTFMNLVPLSRCMILIINFEKYNQK